MLLFNIFNYKAKKLYNMANISTNFPAEEKGWTNVFPPFLQKTALKQENKSATIKPQNKQGSK